MSPQRRVRPEDLRPSSDDEASRKRVHDDDSTAYGPPDPPDVVALEEAMVPPLRLSSYLALATALLHVLPQLRTTRFLSEAMGLCIFALPFILGGYSTGLLGDENNPLTHAALDSSQAMELPSSTLLTVGLVASLAAIAVWLFLKSMLDARGYSLLRHTLSGKDSSERPGRTKTWAFFSANLVQFALAMGAGMGTAPVILRAGATGLVSHDANLFLTLVAPISIGMMLYAWIRVMCMYISAWMAWRPTFIPGALGAAFASPIHGARIFWGSFAMLLPLLSASALILVLCAAGMWAPTVNVDIPHLLLHLCLIGTSIFTLQSLIWFDVAIVTSIGHRVGEFTVAHSHEEAVRMRSAALKANLSANQQQTIAAGYPGIFRAPENPNVQPTSFQEIYDAIASMQPDLVPEPTQEEAQASDRHAPAPEETTPAPDPWLAPPYPISDTDDATQQGLARLHNDILPLTLRTANGQPERRFKGVRNRGESSR